MTATKLVITIKYLKYKERLQILKLPTLRFRCIRYVETWLKSIKF